MLLSLDRAVMFIISPNCFVLLKNQLNGESFTVSKNLFFFNV